MIGKILLHPSGIQFELLLENKISSLENVNAFWKITGDEEIGLELANLINTMGDLSTLVQTFKLENELYYGGCLVYWVTSGKRSLFVKAIVRIQLCLMNGKGWWTKYYLSFL